MALAYVESAVAGVFIGVTIGTHLGLWSLPVAVAFGAWHVWSAMILSNHDASNVLSEHSAR